MTCRRVAQASQANHAKKPSLLNIPRENHLKSSRLPYPHNRDDPESDLKSGHPGTSSPRIM